MTIGPTCEIAGRPRAHGHLRASNADREHAIDTLKAAFVQGCVTKDEFDARVSEAFGSRTYADLARVTADLPPGLAPAPPTSGPARARGSAQAAAAFGSRDRAVVATAVLAVVAWTVAVVAVSPVAAFLAIASGLVSLLLGGTQLLGSLHDQRIGGRPPTQRALNVGPGGAGGARSQDVPPKSTSLVSTAPAVRPGAVW